MTTRMIPLESLDLHLLFDAEAGGIDVTAISPHQTSMLTQDRWTLDAPWADMVTLRLSSRDAAMTFLVRGTTTDQDDLQEYTGTEAICTLLFWAPGADMEFTVECRSGGIARTIKIRVERDGQKYPTPPRPILGKPLGPPIDRPPPGALPHPSDFSLAPLVMHLVREALIERIPELVEEGIELRMRNPAVTPGDLRLTLQRHVKRDIERLERRLRLRSFPDRT